MNVIKFGKHSIPPNPLEFQVAVLDALKGVLANQTTLLTAVAYLMGNEGRRENDAAIVKLAEAIRDSAAAQHKALGFKA
jgi:hypothetical protein